MKSKDSLFFSSLVTCTEHKPEKDLDPTWFIGAALGSFEFTILMKDDGKTIWNNTGSITWYGGIDKKEEYWDNTDWLRRTRDREPKAIKLIPKVVTEEQREDLFNLLDLVTKRGWL